MTPVAVVVNGTPEEMTPVGSLLPEGKADETTPLLAGKTEETIPLEGATLLANEEEATALLSGGDTEDDALTMELIAVPAMELVTLSA